MVFISTRETILEWCSSYNNVAEMIIGWQILALIFYYLMDINKFGMEKIIRRILWVKNK